MDEELMAKFLMGECSEEELCKVNAWLDESDGNARELFRIEQIYHLGKSEEFADEKKIEKAEKQLFKRLAQEEAKRNKVRRLNAWMRYAAMFIGIFFISGLSYHIYQSQSEESKLVAVTARDEVKELMLPDGTKVWLNKHTTLNFLLFTLLSTAPSILTPDASSCFFTLCIILALAMPCPITIIAPSQYFATTAASMAAPIGAQSIIM